MATITLTNVWLTDANDQSQSLILPTSSETRVPTARGEIRTYANGRRRAIGRAGSSQPVSVQSPKLDRAGVALLESWVGKDVLLRDPRGLKLYGRYWSVNVTEHLHDDSVSVSISFENVTWDEAV